MIKFKKTYSFALKSSLYISLFAGVLGVLLMVLFFQPKWSGLFLFGFLLFLSLYVFSFLVIQYRVERFIYRRVKKIYDEVSLLGASSFKNQTITTDIETLSKEVKKFARDKKLEIEL
ncbi:MAG: sensor histidine kinase, partial [Flavobacterium sp.]